MGDFFLIKKRFDAITLFITSIKNIFVFLIYVYSSQVKKDLPKMGVRSQIENPILHPLLFLYQVMQWIIGKALSPRPPKSHQKLHRPKIAIIGAGITGVTSAAHCVGHGFDVVIFEGGSEDSVGGIWSVKSSPTLYPIQTQR